MLFLLLEMTLPPSPQMCCPVFRGRTHHAFRGRKVSQHDLLVKSRISHRQTLLTRSFQSEWIALPHLGIVASDQAIQHANNLEGVSKDRTAVIWSSGIGGLGFFEQEIGNHYSGDGTPRFNPFFIPKMIVDIAAGYISMRHGFKGPNYSPVAACASSTIAIIDAFHLIKLGKVDAVVCGGSDATITRGGIGGFSAMRALSRRNDDYKTASRPYDKDRDGFVMGEGGAALIIESLESAERRGASVLCEVVGTGMSADAYHLTAPHPDGEGAKAVMKLAIEEAGITPEQVDYINVHGTSTPVGDLAELAAIRDIWSERAENTLISSTKSMTGHLLGAAGALEALALMVSMNQSKVPQQLTFQIPTQTFQRNSRLFSTRQSLKR